MLSWLVESARSLRRSRRKSRNEKDGKCDQSLAKKKQNDIFHANCQTKKVLEDQRMPCCQENCRRGFIPIGSIEVN